MSQVIILLIQYFEFQVALSGLPAQDCPVENMSYVIISLRQRL